MTNLLIVSALALVAGFSAKSGLLRSGPDQPATAGARNGREHLLHKALLLAATGNGPDGPHINPFLDSLRSIGLIRRRGRRPVVGKSAYVRWWERARAITVLGAIVVALGIAVAAAIGVIVLGAAFLLEQAIT